jgi:hypothetical protein
LVGARGLGVFLKGFISNGTAGEAEEGAYEELCYSEIVHIYPHWTSPIILRRTIELIFLAQTSKTKLTP